MSRAVIAHGSGAMRRCARAAASAAGLTRRAAKTFLGGAIRAELPAAYHTSSARCGAIVSANALRARTFLPRAAARADAAPFALRAARHLRVSTPIADEHLSKNIVRDVLTNAKAVAIREDIDNLRASSDDKPCVSHLALADFNSLLTSHGVTEPAEQAELIRAFQHAGVVIKFEDVVYLNPSRITRDVLRALPAVPSRVFGATPEELAEMEEEMAATREKVEDAASRARFRSNMIIGVGLLALVTQLCLFIRLTYVELSWDVMEPISYFVGVFNAILVYLYFMVYNRDFSFDDWSSRMQKHFWKRNIGGIDMQRYERITRRLRK